MYKLVRSNYCNYREDYELKLTDEYVVEFNNYFHSKTNHEYLGKIEITPKMMVDAFEWNDVDCDCEITVYNSWDKEIKYKVRLVDFIRDELNEALWDCVYDSEYLGSYDTQDGVVEV